MTIEEYKKNINENPFAKEEKVFILTHDLAIYDGSLPPQRIVFDRRSFFDGSYRAEMDFITLRGHTRRDIIGIAGFNQALDRYYEKEEKKLKALRPYSFGRTFKSLKKRINDLIGI